MSVPHDGACISRNMWQHCRQQKTLSTNTVLTGGPLVCLLMQHNEVAKSESCNFISGCFQATLGPSATG